MSQKKVIRRKPQIKALTETAYENELLKQAASTEQLVESVPYEPKDGLNVPYLCQKELLALIGTADPTRQMAPYEDKNFEIWGVAVASSYADVKRLDLQFELHPKDYWERDPNVTKRLAETKVPIYMHEHFDHIPTSIKFPIEVITQYRKYHTSSISYMLALAYHSFIMTEKPKHVALFGIHMSAGEEYGEQRPACEYWLGRMEGAGMDVEIAPGGGATAIHRTIWI